jgi:signal transduction histidine kinase
MSTDNEKADILLVDDEADIREVLEIALEDLGYDVRVAADGEQALEIFQTHQPALVLTDIKMPSMDGIELLKCIKRENPECEVIMITGHGDMDLAIKSLKHEATDFITKPINVDALEISLKRAHEKIITREKLTAYTRSLEALIREKTELQDNLAALGLMIGSISHNIKGLLTGLDGGVYLVNAGIEKKDMERVKEGWEIIEIMIDRIRTMAGDILLHTKQRKLERKPVELIHFTDEIAQMIAIRVAKQGITLVREFDTHAGTCELDAAYVNTALINILDNAIDACQKNADETDKQIRFSMQADQRQVVFTVEDNGIGMDEAVREKLFTLFHSSKGRKGTGLGLFIANKIVSEHGGSIQVVSTPGKGAKFTIKIPKRPAA